MDPQEHSFTRTIDEEAELEERDREREREEGHQEQEDEEEEREHEVMTAGSEFWHIYEGHVCVLLMLADALGGIEHLVWHSLNCIVLEHTTQYTLPFKRFLLSFAHQGFIWNVNL